MAPRELPPRSSLEIALELQRRFLLVEFDHDEDSPWPIARRVRRAAVVMAGKPRLWIRRDADIVLIRCRDALEDVNESLGFHGAEERKRVTVGVPGNTRVFRVSQLEVVIIVRSERSETTQFLPAAFA